MHMHKAVRGLAAIGALELMADDCILETRDGVRHRAAVVRVRDCTCAQAVTLNAKQLRRLAQLCLKVASFLDMIEVDAG